MIEIVNDSDIYEKISQMINLYNRWRRKFSGEELMGYDAKYHVIFRDGQLVACCGSALEYTDLTKVFHLCVLPQYRMLGLGGWLLDHVTKKCETNLLCATVRSDNTPSLKLFKKHGWIFVNKKTSFNHEIYLIGKRKC